MSTSLIIIGGGIAGLAAGCYARMNGFDTEILEMHRLPGGLCTAWKRQGYTFDLCIHWLTGSGPGSSLYKVWEELGIVQGRTFLDLDCYTAVPLKSGDWFRIFTDPDRLREEMLRIAPGEGPFIDEFTRDLARMRRLYIPVDPGIRDLMRMLPALPLFRKYALPVSELATRIRDQDFRELFVNAFDWHDQSAIFPMMMMAMMAKGEAGYPQGGSLPVVRALESRFLSLGGSVRYGSCVEKILVENDRAVGVRLEGGTELRSGLVLSAADGHSTIFGWLDGRYAGDRVDYYYRSLRPFPPLVFVSLGVAGDYTREPGSFVLCPDPPELIAGKEVSRVIVRNHADDPSLAPPGKTVFSLMVEADWSYWRQFTYPSEEYAREKERAGKQAVEMLSKVFPDIASRVEVIDVATPLTFYRYTGNWQGSYQGWLWTRETANLKIPQVLRGLKNFAMAGHWTAPGGGLPGAAISARNAVKILCKMEKRPFRTTRL
ncbi:MAG: NAD(P)/FAD-dependent oxidoreductase [Methanoregulaceae archaeon]|nr:NAD(P)/FAD-dependent oxidoreductase [Methanoregulaceae archaeon]